MSNTDSFSEGIARLSGEKIHPDRAVCVQDRWDSPEVADAILGQVAGAVEEPWAEVCGDRLRQFRDTLRNDWQGLDLTHVGPLTDWLAAIILARENSLLIGPPGTAKTEIAVRAFELLGLKNPVRGPEERAQLLKSLAKKPSVLRGWQERECLERKVPKYFHYQLSEFTQQEELFGPIEISLLKYGILTRVDLGLLTGPGVRGVFLDEVFKGSSSILNTLLSVTNERSYFNWGGRMRSDLLAFVAASNELPGGFSSGAVGVGAYRADFQTLYAFLDRFAARLQVPLVSGDSPSAGLKSPPPEESELGKAFAKALEREGNRFCFGKPFDERPADMPSINDAMLLGRYCFQHLTRGQPSPFDAGELAKFRGAFTAMAVELRQDPTSVVSRRITWTISPRKLKAIYKIGLAHALVRWAGSGGVIHLGPEDLVVYDLIWDTPTERENLEQRVASMIKHYWR
jgi:hypothetical protein